LTAEVSFATLSGGRKSVAVHVSLSRFQLPNSGTTVRPIFTGKNSNLSFEEQKSVRREPRR
jgi:hypothetical protein